MSEETKDCSYEECFDFAIGALEPLEALFIIMFYDSGRENCITSVWHVLKKEVCCRGEIKHSSPFSFTAGMSPFLVKLSALVVLCYIMLYKCLRRWENIF